MATSEREGLVNRVVRRAGTVQPIDAIAEAVIATRLAQTQTQTQTQHCTVLLHNNNRYVPHTMRGRLK
jgi:hypothetical protein